MDKRIIYPDGDGGIAIIIPAAECGLPIEEIARKDVPSGKPYKIVDAGVLPDDRAFRDAWTADFSAPDGSGIGADAWFAEQEQIAAEKAAAEQAAREQAAAEQAAALQALAEQEATQ